MRAARNGCPEARRTGGARTAATPAHPCSAMRRRGREGSAGHHPVGRLCTPGESSLRRSTSRRTTLVRHRCRAPVDGGDRWRDSRSGRRFAQAEAVENARVVAGVSMSDVKRSCATSRRNTSSDILRELLASDVPLAHRDFVHVARREQDLIAALLAVYGMTIERSVLSR